MHLNPLLNTGEALAAQPRGRRAAICLARLQPVLREVEASLDRRLRVAEMSRGIGLSPFHFSREFRRVTGMSPYAYVRGRRIARGSLLLAGTRLPIEEIARMVGFSTHAHFTQAFVDVTSMTPRSYRMRYGAPGPSSIRTKRPRP